jgi:hypothetical protein
VTEVMVQPGARVDASAPLVRVADPKALELDLLLGREVPLPAVGDSVQVITRGAAGRVEGIAPVGDGSAGMRACCANQERGSALGRKCYSHIDVERFRHGKGAVESRNRLRIPASALVYWQGQTGVFIRTGKGVRFALVGGNQRRSYSRGARSAPSKCGGCDCRYRCAQEPAVRRSVMLARLIDFSLRQRALVLLAALALALAGALGLCASTHRCVPRHLTNPGQSDPEGAGHDA